MYIRVCFFSTLIWGILAHGMALFNKYSLYEDISQLFDVGTTYISGRWMLDILHELEVFFLGGSYSLPLLNGLMSILYIALSACIIATLLDIRQTGPCIAISGILVTTPALTGLFGYMFTAPHYMLGLLLAVAGTYLICKRKKWYLFISGCILIACSIGIYQANIPVVLCLMLLYFSHDICAYPRQKPLAYTLAVLYYLAACLCFMVIYAAVNRVYLHIKDAELIDYQGISSAGLGSLGLYLKRLPLAYKLFFSPPVDSSAFMYPSGMLLLYRFVLIITGLLVLLLLVRIRKEGFGKIFGLLLPLLLFPLASYFIYVMCDAEDVHSLMMYSHTMLFVMVIWLISELKPANKAVTKSICAVGLCVSILFSGLYVRYDNVCYLKAEIVRSQMTSYFTTMITQIKSTEGYTDDMPIALINFYDKEDASLTTNDDFADVNTTPYYDTDTMINNFAVHSFIRNWCGFSPVFDYSAYQTHPEVQQMPCYPDEGSIKIIDGVVIVKGG